MPAATAAITTSTICMLGDRSPLARSARAMARHPPGSIGSRPSVPHDPFDRELVVGEAAVLVDLVVGGRRLEPLSEEHRRAHPESELIDVAARLRAALEPELAPLLVEGDHPHVLRVPAVLPRAVRVGLHLLLHRR